MNLTFYSQKTVGWREGGNSGITTVGVILIFYPVIKNI